MVRQPPRKPRTERTERQQDQRRLYRERQARQEMRRRLDAADLLPVCEEYALYRP